MNSTRSPTRSFRCDSSDTSLKSHFLAILESVELYPYMCLFKRQRKKSVFLVFNKQENVLLMSSVLHIVELGK